MKYTLTNSQAPTPNESMFAVLKKLWPYITNEKLRLVGAFLAILCNSGLTILAPILVGRAVDHYIIRGDYHGVLVYVVYLLATYLGMLLSGYIQTRIMGIVGQRILFNLRNAIFTRLQELPIAFFNQNKGGDLISRINNDTDKLNQFFSRSLMQFVGNVFVIIGAGIAMLVVNFTLGSAALVPAVVLLVFAQLTTEWVKRKNLENLQTTGGMSAEIAESLQNFKVIIAFNRRDYFRKKFEEVNEKNYHASISSGIANSTYVPTFGLASNVGQMIVIVYGLYLISQGSFTFGLLISYLAYVSRFYDPLRQMAALWSDLQTALAAWERIGEILAMKSNLTVVKASEDAKGKGIIEFKKVGFQYPDGAPVLTNINFVMYPGKTYALVGPTGGGKTTTASLIARLYDPTEGTVYLNGQDIRTYEADVRTAKIGFILQDPFLFTGTVRENILYGNNRYAEYTNEQLVELLEKEGLSDLLNRFDQGLDTPVTTSADGISLGQKQLIAFMRALLRHPDILILDEASANIDTVTEQILDEILKRLPAQTARVIIAHRLNTIENADEILFVNGGKITPAGSLDHAVELLTSGVKSS